MLRKCKYCGKEFNVCLSKVKRGWGIYCSKKCYGVVQRTRVLRVCEYCGKEFKINPSKLKQSPGRFCSHECRGKVMSGENHPSWKGGWTDRAGYKIIVVKGKETKQHRHIIERHLNRSLTKDEVVHHVDGNRANNDIKNLQVMTRAEHNTLHFKGGTRLRHKDKTKYGSFICPVCGKEFEKYLSSITVKEPCCSKSCSGKFQHFND